MTFTSEGRIEQRARIWLRRVRFFKKSEVVERGDADIEDKRRQLAALDELRLRRERRLEVWRQAQPDAIDPSGPSAASASESVDTDADSHAKE
ncbi:MAG: hypothetical protein LQ340_005628 [Diploschistes diacapsis]|nr:MAG: hypothetical protein LQ340_005628 [Diploschistes diacapsis]